MRHYFRRSLCNFHMYGKQDYFTIHLNSDSSVPAFLNWWSSSTKTVLVHKSKLCLDHCGWLCSMHTTFTTNTCKPQKQQKWEWKIMRQWIVTFYLLFLFYKTITREYINRNRFLGYSQSYYSASALQRHGHKKRSGNVNMQINISQSVELFDVIFILVAFGTS